MYFSVGRNVQQILARSIRQRYILLRQTKLFSTQPSEETKKLLIRNVFRDNPAAKYWLVAGLSAAVGTTYYVYNNQDKKKLVLSFLPPSPSHYCLPRDDEVRQIKLLLENCKQSPKEVEIVGPSGSGKTQLARMLAESLDESRKESYWFKLWPRDEVTCVLNGSNKHSLLLSLKQLAVKLGCVQDDLKSVNTDVDSQLNVVSQVIQDKLKQKHRWIMIVDHHDDHLTKWLPDSNWGNGYVIYTTLSHGTSDQRRIPSFSLAQMGSQSSQQLFHDVINEGVESDEHVDPLPEQLLELLQHNPVSVVYSAVFFKHQLERNDKYSYQDLFHDIEHAFILLNEANPETSELLNIQTSCVTLAARAISEASTKLLHVFDFLGSCSYNHIVPLDVLLCHLNIPEFHIWLQPDISMVQETAPSQEDTSNSSGIQANADLEVEQSVWSFHGLAAKVVQLSERIKLEVDAIKSLLGYGGDLLGIDSKPPLDGLEFVRSCPLLLTSKEPSADIETFTSHAIVHNVLRQLFVHVTIPFLEREHLIVAERKHQQKSYFARLQGLDAHRVIGEYRQSLGDNISAEERADRQPTVVATPSIAGYLTSCNTRLLDDDSTTSKHPNIIGHVQEHFNRVVSSFSNFYRMVATDDKGVVARALLLPHLETVLGNPQLSAASKGLLYQTMARLHTDVLADWTTSQRLLSKAFVTYRDRYGENSLHMASLLEQQAEICSLSEELQRAKALLEQALGIYQKQKKTSIDTSGQSLDHGKTLVSLGVTCASLGESARAKDLLEKGLMELQNAAPGDPHAKENKWFAAEISSAVTSLGHAYLSLGNINQGRKLLELALMGHQNTFGEAHAEIIRTLTTLSIAHAMQGNAQESKRLRNKAGKIKKKIDMRSPLFLT